jgi:hypothetical protein
MSASRGKNPSTSWREKLTARPVLEPMVFVALALVYLWVVRPTRNDWLRIPFMAVIAVIPLASNLLHRDRLRDLGLRLDNLWASTREVGIATLVGALAVLAIAVLTGGPYFSRRMLVSFLSYPLWGLVQQYAMQSFSYRRMREGIAHPALAAGATAFLFASVHWPNWPLTLLTLVGGYVWCRLFERHPNLLTLALSHGLLAVLLRYSWSAEWLRNLRIGPSYWEWGL